MKGILALDIDGTLTSEYVIPAVVVHALREKWIDGWIICLITGRSYSFASIATEFFDFPYYLALQNGADILQMPQKIRLSYSYLLHDITKHLDDLTKRLQSHFLIYSGYDKGDFCYFLREGKPSPTLRTYLKRLEALSRSKWRSTESWQEIPQATFPMIKIIGNREEVDECIALLKKHHAISTCFIQDLIQPGRSLGLITDKSANKGTALDFFRVHFDCSYAVAAGDDENDIPMLECADKKIVMETATESLRKRADIIAGPAKRHGIIAVLEQI